MTWISLICLLALSNSAFARAAYGGGYGTAPIPEMSKILHPVRDQIIERPLLPTLPVATQGYGQLQTSELPTTFVQQDVPSRPKLPLGHGSQLLVPTLPKTLPVQGYDQFSQGYGTVPRILQFDQSAQVPLVQTPTPADLLCRGQRPETTLKLEDGHKFVVCLDDGKGVEQECPKGLFYHEVSRRCERKFGPKDPCSTQPCLNDGQCIPTDSWYQCQCAPGFDGVNCELDARVCQTQQPCGQSPDVRCQSFRTNAALQYICILQNGLAYGLNPQQVHPSPCREDDGPHALAVSDKGFIMCDGDRMFVESCPGGTVWDDINKACSWPDLQGHFPQFDKPVLGYGEQRTIINKPIIGGLHEQMKFVESHGAKMTLPRIEQPKVIHSFDQTLAQPYGAKLHVPRPQLDQSKLVRPFEHPKLMHPHRTLMTVSKPQLEQPFGGEITVPQPIMEQPKFGQPYGTELTVPQPTIEQPRFFKPYGGDITVDQQKFVQPIKKSFEY